jgi:hypothetical protein
MAKLLKRKGNKKATTLKCIWNEGKENEYEVETKEEPLV